MGIEFVKSDRNFNFVRPTGYQYPSGLGTGAVSTISFSYLVIGGGGMHYSIDYKMKAP